MPTSSGANMQVSELTTEQIAEQNERANERDAVNGGQEPGEGETEVVALDEDGLVVEPKPEPAEKPIAMSPQDLKRQAMADRFKRPGIEERPFDGDLTNEENLYGNVAAAPLLDVDPNLPEPGVPVDQQQQAPTAAEEKKYTIKVRGKDVVLTERELLERASKVEAADSYMEEGRQLLEQAKLVRRGTAPDPQHPEDQNGADDGQDGDNRQDQTRRPGLDLKSVVEKIQFGDPEEAAAELATIISSVTDKAVNEGHVARLVSNDLARAKLDLKAFKDANPALDADELASRTIENLIYTIYREEIVKQGVDEAQIPTNPKDLADWHRLYRVHGHPVSKTADVLTQAKTRFEKWRGTSTPAKPATTRKEAPRVAVNVDRTERRMAIPTQPSRGVAPHRDAPVVTQETSRKAAVQDMRRARGQSVVT